MLKTIKYLMQDDAIDQRGICAYFCNIITEVRSGEMHVGSNYFPRNVILSVKDDDVHVFEANKWGEKLGYIGRITLDRWHAVEESTNMGTPIFSFLIKCGEKKGLVKLMGPCKLKYCYKFFDFVEKHQRGLDIDFTPNNQSAK